MAFYVSLVWLVDYAIVSVLVFSISQAYVLIFPHHDSTNVSALWTLFAMTFAMQVRKFPIRQMTIRISQFLGAFQAIMEEAFESEP